MDWSTIDPNVSAEVFEAIVDNAIRENTIEILPFLPNLNLRRDVIAEFHGRRISQKEYLILESTGKCRYVVRRHGLILDCQNQRYIGNCKASLANSLLHAVHRDNGAAATADSRLAVSGSSEKKVATLVATTSIQRLTEVMWHYEYLMARCAMEKLG